MTEREITFDRPAGWARFVWFDGDVVIKDDKGNVVPSGPYRSPKDHLKEMGLSDAEIDHALGRSPPGDQESGLELKPGFYVLQTDGGVEADKGQAAGEAAIGAVLMRPSLVVIDEISEAIGWVEDHHEAEYRALIAGLRMARRHKIDRIRVFLDSMLVVNSVDGPWRVRPKHLSALCDQARGLLGEFVDIKLAWVPRKWNAKADARASKALG